MSRVRACVPCSAARIQCDLARPSCGRCTSRGLICSGLPLDDLFVFRDENEVAKRNSKRARGERGQSFNRSGEASSSSSIVPRGRQALAADNVPDIETLQRQFLWLNQRALAEIPEPLKRDVETRAIERFFINWTLHPSNDGGSPGHMHNLPALYSATQPDSVLWHAVRAVAFAEVRNQSIDNVPFNVKARQQYGAALNSVRTIVTNENDIANDRVLSAILLLDNFELLYLARNDPLSPHKDAIRHVLSIRGDKQLYSPTRFSLWRLTHYRLQSWQTLFQEEPDAQQIAWVSKLNIDHPDLRVCSHVLHMNILSAAAKVLMRTPTDSEAIRIAKINQAMFMMQEMHTLILTIESFMTEMKGVWKATVGDPRNIRQPEDFEELHNFPIPQFPYQRILSYDDIWLAYIWNFYIASQIVLRESIVNVINYTTTLQGQQAPNEHDIASIQTQRNWIEVLSAAVIESFPQLLGFTQEQGSGWPRMPQQGRMAGRLFALFSMWVIERAQFTSDQHKKTASEVVSWINARHGLD
ncbi:hypothetical protein BT63DRAFT_431674 [Microthyrium microscopicum]|uniref:Zn(2)-C6 fungal-type domain-containing protein n=1 Tax=Microthyrium microscopicum TaxID=703497 RepID=A0A6A6UPJ9_9PEZI|nr:hypothetical protein BT63DRAFT_431674 [Microthyrium microscopicum]